MPVTQAQLDHVANGALDYYFNKGDALQQSIQSRPMLKKMEGKAKAFPGGKGDIDLAIQGKFGDGSGNDVLKGYSYDDTVAFYNPTNLQRIKFPWREHHIGITVTETELKNDGISVTDEMGSTSEHTGRDVTMLINLFQNKLFDFGEQYSISLNNLLWGDGTGDAKALAGIRSIIVPDPSIGTIGGMDRSVAANAFIRNRARTAAFGTKVGATPALAVHGGGAVTSATANGGALWQTLQVELRQLRRYGGQPDTFLAGSDFIGALETEMRANGYYSQTGFKKAGDGAMGPMLFDGTTVEYDPTLDDLGFAKRGYWFDSRHIFLMKMTGEWRKVRKPARAHDKFVMYRSITSTGQLVAQQANSALVIDIA
jgi:hypothetical protein